jgi:hypothetical protein
MSDDLYVNADLIMACVDLASRTGASNFEIGHVHHDVPLEEAGWYAHVTFKGARIMTQDHRSPDAAAMALAERLLDGATCRCLQPVTINPKHPGCQWKLVGRAWQSSCDAPPIKYSGPPGDYQSIQQALAKHADNRAGRWLRRRR